VFEVRGVVLPEREHRRFWISDGVVRLEPGPDADVVVEGGWLVPGLVDVHTHPGSEKPGDPFTDDKLRRHLGEHRDAGVLLVRTPGSAARIPDWVADDPTLPRVVSAGQWLATPGRFFAGYGRDVTEDDLARACLDEVKAASGWCKIIGDWKPDDPPLPLNVLMAAVAEVHDVGGRVAVHCQTAEGCRNAVLAGVDSLEHGMNLDPALLNRMAAQGTTLVPTMTVFGRTAEAMRASTRDSFRDWWLAGWRAQQPLVRSAHDAGVTVLAGTDSVPYGSVAEEIGWLIRAGLSPEAALGAGSWSARSWLGLPGLVDGAPADLVAYSADPLVNPDVVRHPSRIILRGRIVR
jgi:imidazolonepropionase-like amidohydrolase